LFLEESVTRIAYLSHQSGVGSEMALVRLLSALDRNRIEPLVALPEEGPLRAEIEALSIPVHVLPLAWWIPATHWSAESFLEQLAGLEERAAALEAWLVRERIGLVHTNTIVTLEGALAAARLGLPHVWHSRGLFGGGFPPAYLDDTRFFLSAVDLLASAVVCVSEGVRRQTAEVCRLAPLRVVYDGFDLDRFLARPVAAPEAIRARYGLAETARVVACVGGIQRRKGQLDLVEAAALLATDFPDLVFVLAGGAGDAEYLAALLERIEALGLEGHFRLIGFEPEVRDLLAISAALVHPSHSEGFGLAILEAVAVGLPVVATRCGGPEEIIEDGVSGLLVPPRDPPALAAALRRVLGVPMAARLLGASAATRAARAFSLETTAREMKEIYRELLAAPVAGQELRARIADFVADEVLTRARLAAAAAPPAEPPPAPRTPPGGSWLSGLRRRFGGSKP
jgi:glycosyltransferase involved in cell wall biosynthesis